MYYHQIIDKLNATIQEYHYIAIIHQYEDAFEIPDQVTRTKDGQINHLLAITVSLVKQVPDSPYLEELFDNFMKDYLHLVNPELPCHNGEFYISHNFVPETRTIPARKLVLNFA